VITLTSGIELLRPSVIEFGAGRIGTLSQWIAARRARRTLV